MKSIRKAVMFLLACICCNPIIKAQNAPICDVTCSPDPSSPSYGGVVASRPKLMNARGSFSAIVAKGGPQQLSQTDMVIGSQSYNYVIPILSLPGRAGMDLTLNLYYNSRVWDIDTVNGTTTFNADRDFPSYGFRLDFGYMEYDVLDAQYILTERDGTKRALPNNGGFNTIDGSFINFNPSTKVLTYKNGMTVQYAAFPSNVNLFRPTQIKDTNGNYISITYKSGHDQLVESITDTLGRVINFNYNASFQLSTISQNVQISSNDPSGIHTYAVFYWGPLYSAGAQWYNFSSALTVNGAPGTPLNVLLGCTYPYADASGSGINGAGYSFIYGDWGIINKITRIGATNTTHPGAASRSYVNYNYPPANAGPLTDAPTYTQQTVSPDGLDTNTSVWTYEATKNGTGIVTSLKITGPVTGSANNITVTSLDPATGLLSSVQIQDGSGTPLRTTNYTWTTSGGANVPATIATTLNDTGQQSSVQYLSYDVYGNAGEVKEVGFAGELLRDTVTNFGQDPQTGTTIPAVSHHILNLPGKITVKNGAGATIARTDLVYDTTSISDITDASHHDDSLTVHGNLTAITRYSDAAGGSGAVTRHFYYDSTGNVRTAELDCCNQKVFNFDVSNQYAYPKSAVRGPNGGTQFTNSTTWNFDFGLMLTSTDENNQVTQYQYDPMNRLTGITLPPQGSTSVQFSTQYDDISATPAITKYASPSSVTVSKTVTTTDGLGHVLRTDTYNGPSLASSGIVSSTTVSYDKLWRSSLVSNPFAPGDSTRYTNFVYDALGRTRQVIPPSSGYTQYDYSGNTITSTDPAGKQRKNYSDALGRLVEVDEPTDTSQGTNATARITISGQLGGAVAGTGNAPLPVSSTPLASFVTSDGSSHVFYLGASQHILHLFWNSAGGWQVEDVTSMTGNAAAPNSSLSGVALSDGSMHVFYTGSNQHVYQIFYSSGGWQSQDLSAITGNTLAASGTALASDSGAASEPYHVYYLGTNQHVYVLFISSNTSIWQNQDLTGATGNTLAANGSKLAVSVASDGTTHLFYVGSNQHVYQLTRNNGGSFGTAYQASTNSFSDAGGWNSSAYYPSIRLGDVNGDGKPDVCGRGAGGVICGLNNGSGIFNAVTQWESGMTDAAGWNQAQYTSTLMLGDINGDGKADNCGRGQSAIYCEPSNGSSFGASVTSSIFTDAQGWGAANYYYGSLRMGDVNGDGKLDLCGRGSGGILCALNTGNGSFNAPTLWTSDFSDVASWNSAQYGTTIMIADINGDGKADVCGRAQAGILCALSTGSGFGPAYLASTDFSDAQSWGSASYYYGSIRLADVNGDGKPDICGRSSGGVICALNNGDGTFQPVRQWEGAFTDVGGWNQPQYGSTMMFADINGDGRADVCGRGGAGIICELSTGNAAWQNQDLTAITGNTLSLASSSLSSYIVTNGNPLHVHYIGTDQHLYHLFLSTTGTWTNQDLTASTGVLAAAGSAITSLQDYSSGFTRIYFLGTNQHLNETACGPGQCWVNTDMTNYLGASPGTGSAIVSTGPSGGSTVHVYYLAANQHVFHMFLNGGWTNQDLSVSESTLSPDSGTVSLTVDGFTASACFGTSANFACSGQPINNSAAQVATILAQGLNAPTSPVTAMVFRSTITLTWKTPGPFNLTVAPLSTTHDNPSQFPNSSFTSPATNFGGGTGPLTYSSTYTATTYSYDPLGNLTGSSQAAVGQPGTAQTRSFAYDGLSRLTSSATPEAGTVMNSYTALNGGSCGASDPAMVCRSQDARNIVSNFTYDGLNRLLSIQYTNTAGGADPANTPPVAYHYDAGGSAAFALTRLTSVTEGPATPTPVNSHTFTYDNLGRVLFDTQSIDQQTYTIQYGYNLAGQVTSITYPSQHVVAQSYDAIGRLCSVGASGSCTTAQYLYGASYNAAGEPLGFNLGNGVQTAFTYNDHLQLSSLRYFKTGSSTDILNLGYDYTSTGQPSNNGQIQAMHYFTQPGVEDQTKSESFSYDQLGRLKAAQTLAVNSTPGTWNLKWGYDMFGNRYSQTLVGGNVSIGQPSFAMNGNQIVGYCYDSAGNLEDQASCPSGSHQYAYDGTSRIFNVNSSATYTYFGSLRIKKVAGSTVTRYIYSGSRVIAEYTGSTPSLSTEYIYAGSQLLATIPAGGAITYHHPDHLSNRAESDSTGTPTRTFGHFPFGEIWYETGTPDKWKFTSYERDSGSGETGLDYASSRYYGSGFAGFLSPDPYSGSMKLGNPQSLNRYSYVGGDPVNFTDPSGLQRVCTLMSGAGDEVFACTEISGLVPDPFGGGSSGGSGGGIGGVIGAVIGVLNGGPLTTIPGNCFLPGDCQSLAVPTFFPLLQELLPPMPQQGCEFGPCGDQNSQLGNGFTHTGNLGLDPAGIFESALKLVGSNCIKYPYDGTDRIHAGYGRLGGCILNTVSQPLPPGGTCVTQQDANGNGKKNCYQAGCYLYCPADTINASCPGYSKGNRVFQVVGVGIGCPPGK